MIALLDFGQLFVKNPSNILKVVYSYCATLIHTPVDRLHKINIIKPVDLTERNVYVLIKAK